jgi:hypothetical protein
MGNGPTIDDDDPLAGAPDEVLAAFIALGGHASRVRDAKKAAPPVSAARLFLAESAAKLSRPLPRQSSFLNRKV